MAPQPHNAGREDGAYLAEVGRQMPRVGSAAHGWTAIWASLLTITSENDLSAKPSEKECRASKDCAMLGGYATRVGSCEGSPKPLLGSQTRWSEPQYRSRRHAWQDPLLPAPDPCRDLGVRRRHPSNYGPQGPV